MLVLNVEDVKGLVQKLLSGEAFAKMYVYNLEVKSKYFLSIDGKINDDFYDDKEQLENKKYVLWDEVKPIFYEAIKGDTLPVSFKITLMPVDDLIGRIITYYGLTINPDDISSLSINIYYERTGVTITTGTSLKVFSLDRTIEETWERYVKELLKSLEIN